MKKASNRQQYRPGSRRCSGSSAPDHRGSCCRDKSHGPGQPSSHRRGGTGEQQMSDSLGSAELLSGRGDRWWTDRASGTPQGRRRLGRMPARRADEMGDVAGHRFSLLADCPPEIVAGRTGSARRRKVRSAAASLNSRPLSTLTMPPVRKRSGDETRANSPPASVGCPPRRRRCLLGVHGILARQKAAGARPAKVRDPPSRVEPLAAKGMLAQADGAPDLRVATARQLDAQVVPRRFDRASRHRFAANRDADAHNGLARVLARCAAS